MIYWLAQVLGWLVFSPLYLPRMHNADRLPMEGGCIVVSNHLRWFDPFILIPRLRRPMRIMAKKDVFSVPIFRHVAKWFGAFPVDREGNDIGAVKTALRILKDGEVLCIFPEGTRSKSGELLPLHDGATLFAIKSAVPVIPIHIAPYRLFKKTHIYVGEPMSFSDLPKRPNAENLKTGTQRIAKALLGPEKGQEG